MEPTLSRKVTFKRRLQAWEYQEQLLTMRTLVKARRMNDFKKSHERKHEIPSVLKVKRYYH